VLVQLLRTEAKVATEELTSMVNMIANNPNAIDPKKLDKYSVYLRRLYRNYKVINNMKVENTKVCRRVCSIRSLRATSRNSTRWNIKGHTVICNGSLFICSYIKSNRFRVCKE